MTRFKVVLLFAILLIIATPALSQDSLLTRTTIRRETRRFAYGGTITVIGAPRGAVTVEGWPRNEVELIAEIELKAPTEAELDQLATVNSFVFDEDVNHLRVLTTGTSILTITIMLLSRTLMTGNRTRIFRLASMVRL